MKLEEARIGYASIAILEYRPSGKIAIETISVTRDSCDLSGAWLLDRAKREDIEAVIEGKLLIILNDSQELRNAVSVVDSKIVTTDAFLNEAAKEVDSAMKLFQDFKELNDKEYSDYMLVKPAERKLLPKVVKKNLVEPNFSNWPSSINLLAAEEELENLGKLGSIDGTVDEMRQVLSSSRLIQLLINMWKNDETERLNRQYVTGNDSAITILPISWLQKLG